MFQICVLHELDIAEIRETLAAHRVARRVNPGLHVNPGQIPQRVSILPASQPSDCDPPRFAIVLLHVSVQLRPDPRRHLRALLLGGLRHSFRRHAPLLERRCDPLPLLEVLAARTFDGHLFESNSAHRRRIAVALKAVLPDGCERRRSRVIRPPNRPPCQQGHYEVSPYELHSLQVILYLVNFLRHRPPELRVHLCRGAGHLSRTIFAITSPARKNPAR